MTRLNRDLIFQFPLIPLIYDEYPTWLGRDTTTHSMRMPSSKNTWKILIVTEADCNHHAATASTITKIIHLCYQALLQLLGESLKHKDTTGVLHLQVTFKGMRRCLRFTWAILFTAKSSLAPSSLLYDQNCSQQSSPVRSTPPLKHTQIYTSSKSFTHMRPNKLFITLDAQVDSLVVWTRQVKLGSVHCSWACSKCPFRSKL